MQTDIVLTQTFDQNTYSMLSEKAFKSNAEQYFGASGGDEDDVIVEIKKEKLDQLGHLQPTYGNRLNQTRERQLPQTTLNHLTFDVA